MLLSGCVKIEYEQVFDRDGNSQVSERIDLSTLIALEEEYGGEADYGSVCENVTQERPGVGCEFENGILTMSKAMAAAEGRYVFLKSSEFPYTIYSLEIRTLPEFGDPEEFAQGPDTDSDFASAESREAAETLSSAEAEVTYRIRMPGEITLAENGAIEDGWAVYDVIGLMSDGEYIRVESRELDIISIGLAGMAALGVAAAIAFILMRK